MSETNWGGQKGATKMGIVSTFFMAIGSIIGAGIFASTPIATKIVGGPGVVIGFLCGAMFLLFKELPDVVMISVLPANGAGYMMATRLVHPVLGMINSFSMLITGTLKIATLALTFSTYFCMLFKSIPELLVSVLCVVLFTILSLFGLKLSSNIQNVAVVILTIALLIYVVLGMPHNTLSLKEVLIPTVELSRLWAAIGILHGSLYGANALMYMAEEIKNPRRTIPIAYLGSTFGCAILYGFVAWVTVGGKIPFYEINNLAQVAETFMGPGMLAFFISGGALLAVITSINAVMLMFSRSTFVAARDKFFPASISKINKYGAPQNSLILNSVIALILIFSRFDLADVTMITTIPGTLLMPFAFFPLYLIMRKYPLSYKRNFFHTPHWAACVFAIATTVFSLVTGVSVLKTMGKRNWMSMVIYYGLGAVYAVIRILYLKKRNFNLVKNMKEPYEPWEKHEKMLREQQAAKKA